eukprot:1066001-Amphidinium_carterae.2
MPSAASLSWHLQIGVGERRASRHAPICAKSFSHRPCVHCADMLRIILKVQGSQFGPLKTRDSDRETTIRCTT